MEPVLMTEERLHGVFAELEAREPIFHRPELGTTRADFERMIVSDYWEEGASGRATAGRMSSMSWSSASGIRWRSRDFHCREIAQDNYLLTYTLVQGERVTRRATLWRRTADGWRALYHQGTVAEGS